MKQKNKLNNLVISSSDSSLSCSQITSSSSSDEYSSESETYSSSSKSELPIKKSKVKKRTVSFSSCDECSSCESAEPPFKKSKAKKRKVSSSSPKGKKKTYHTLKLSSSYELELSDISGVDSDTMNGRCSSKRNTEYETHEVINEGIKQEQSDL